MRYPSVFVNHGGGPMPLLGSQMDIVRHFQQVKEKFLPKEPPKAIVVVSAHFESNPISITSASKPPMLYDYHGFPPEAYKVQYPAPGSPDLAKRIQSLLKGKGIPSELDEKRGFDHGVFIPLKIMFPEADIPVVTVSLNSSMDADAHVQLGKALSSLSDDGILLLGSGYTFHNMGTFFNPSPQIQKASANFNHWLKDTILSSEANWKEETATTDTCSTNVNEKVMSSLEHSFQHWAKAPGGRLSHPREEHLLPLFVVASAAAASTTTPYQPQLTQESDEGMGNYLITAYRFA